MKKTAILISLLVIALAFCSCAENTVNTKYDDIEMDIEKLAEHIAGEVVFDDDLIRLSDSVVAASYIYEGAERTVVYAGGGATAEKIIVVSAPNKETAESISAKLIEYVDTQIAWFADYNSSELARLDNAYVEQFGRYAVYCVASDISQVSSAVSAFADSAIAE